MTNDNYMNAIREAQNLLNELLNDPDHGKLTFMGMRGLDDLTITGPRELDDFISGTVLAIGCKEWMAVAGDVGNLRQWQSFRAGKRITNEELYLLALADAERLSHCHAGL